MGPLRLIMQTSNSYWWMMQVGESRMAYRRSNTLRCRAIRCNCKWIDSLENSAVLADTEGATSLWLESLR